MSIWCLLGVKLPARCNQASELGGLGGVGAAAELVERDERPGAALRPDRGELLDRLAGHREALARGLERHRETAALQLEHEPVGERRHSTMSRARMPVA